MVVINGVTYPHITVSKGMGGFFAVLLDWNASFGFAEPWTTGVGRYEMQCDAVDEGKQWAKNLGIPFVAPKPDVIPANQDVVAQLKEIVPDIVVIEMERRQDQC